MCGGLDSGRCGRDGWERPCPLCRWPGTHRGHGRSHKVQRGVWLRSGRAPCEPSASRAMEAPALKPTREIGRAACGEGVCQNGYISGVSISMKKKTRQIEQTTVNK